MTMPSWAWLLIMAVFLMSTRLAVPTPEPSPSPLCCCCSRSLFTILWGFAFAFGGLTLDAWHTADAHDQRAASFRRKLYYVVFFGPVALFTNLLALFYDLGAHRLLSKSLNNMPDNMPDNMPGRERELAKKAAKIIANCKVVLGTSEGKLPQRHGTQLQADITDQEHPLVLGSRLPENSYMVQLNYEGKEALLRSGVLPGYKRLQLLQENTSFAMFLNGMQAFGYVLAAVVRVQTGLLVSPIETIGLTFSILVFIHSVSHFVAAPCHCPLIVYLSPDQEQDKVLQMCNSTEWRQDQFNKVILFDSFLGSSAVGIPLLLLPFTGSVMFYRPGTPPVHCITADASSWELLFIYLGPLLFTFSAFSYLAIYLCTGCLILGQDQRRTAGTAQRNIIPTGHDISQENNVHDFIEHIRGVDVARRGIRILIIDIIHSVGTVGGMILALVTTIVYWDAKFAERTSGIVHIWPFIG